MKIIYIGGSDAMDTPGGRLLRLIPTEVSDDVAGRAPEPRFVEAHHALHAAHEAHDHNLAALLREELTTLDGGNGLLAGFETYVAAPSKSKAAAVDQEVVK